MKSKASNNGDNLGFESKLWNASNKLRGHMDAAETFYKDLHPSLKVDFILANPPFNQKLWGQESLKNNVCWKFGYSLRHLREEAIGPNLKELGFYED